MSYEKNENGGFNKKKEFHYETTLEYDKEASDNLTYLKEHFGILERKDVFVLGIKALKVIADKQKEGWVLGLTNKERNQFVEVVIS